MDALLDALGYLGDSLDKPGRAIRGLLSGKTREGLAAIPFSDAMGITDQAERTSGSDLLRGMGIDAGEGIGGTLAGIGTEILTDPLTWTGVGLGARLGSKAGAAAAARGPRYSTTADDLLRQTDEFPEQWMRDAARDRIGGLQSAAPGVFAEVPDGAKVLGVGAEGLALSNPAGDVTRIGLANAGEKGRPIADTMLQPMRTADYAGNGGVVGRAERLPFADAVGSRTYWDSPAKAGGQDRLGQLFDDAMGDGLDFMDMKAANAGRVGGAAGRDVIIDPGAALLDGFKGSYNPVVAAAEPGSLMGRLLDMLGTQDMIRGGLNPSFTGSFGRVGGGLGAGAGVASRL